MAAIMDNTKYAFKNATDAFSAPVMYLGLEDNWLKDGKAPLYLKGRITDFPEFQAGRKVTLINGSEKLSATIDSVLEDAHGWGMNVEYYVTALILATPDKPFESIKNVEGGTIYLGVGPKSSAAPESPAAKTVTKSNSGRYLLIGAVVIGAAFLLWKYKDKVFKK